MYTCIYIQLHSHQQHPYSWDPVPSLRSIATIDKELCVSACSSHIISTGGRLFADTAQPLSKSLTLGFSLVSASVPFWNFPINPPFDFLTPPIYMHGFCVPLKSRNPDHLHSTPEESAGSLWLVVQCFPSQTK
uniref:Uncharacterized protein n=1 Tax=Mus musculus TaxID=10090 RepID=Q3UQH2_MOUSE|nr:unnamed protein product [Mus musculus]